jgi:GT2 family glycosyltransferase
MDWDLIVYDDCSGDDTWSVVRALQDNESRIRYFRNDARLGLHKTRNKAIAVADGDLLFFLEDDIILEPESLQILVDTYHALNGGACKIGAIAPSLVLVGKENVAFQRKIFDYIQDLRFGNNGQMACVTDHLTGLISKKFAPHFETVQEVDDVHACSLYPKSVFIEEGGFEERAYTGNYMYAEAEYNIKIRKKGYRLLFQPKAIAYHYTHPSGGCRMPFLPYAYYSVRNHTLYLGRNYGARALYMIPSFMVFMGMVSVIYLFRRGNV